MGEFPKRGDELFKDEPLDIKVEKNTKKTAQNVIEEYNGVRKSNIVRVNQSAQKIKSIVKDPVERRAMAWMRDLGGDQAKIRSLIENPKFVEYKPELEKALRPTPEMTEALAKIEKYYQQAGDVAKKHDAIENVLDDYLNRIYQPERKGDFIKAGLRTGLKKTTSHGKHRYFETMADAVEGGKKFATTDIADLMSIHGEEMSNVITNRKLSAKLTELGLSKETTTKKAPAGWTRLESLERRKLVLGADDKPILDKDGDKVYQNVSTWVPKELAEKLAPITDPDHFRKIGLLKNLRDLQNLAKTNILGYSAFHSKALALQNLYNNQGRQLGQVKQICSNVFGPEFNHLEIAAVRDGGIEISTVNMNIDVLSKMMGDNPDIFKKVQDLPVVKQYLAGARANTNFIFNQQQRYYKVKDWADKMDSWVKRNPDATKAEYKKQAISIGREVNAIYGGLNWENMGFTKSTLSLLRAIFLAPDWLISSLATWKYALTDGFTGGGMAAKGYVASALITGMALTQFLNKVCTGHFTDKNEKGHQWEIQVSPGVYVSMFPAGMGEGIKLISMIHDNGVTQGSLRYLQGKLAPGTKLFASLASGTTYGGRPLFKKSDSEVKKVMKTVGLAAQDVVGLPIGASSISEYLTDKDIKKNPLSLALVASGIARYSANKKQKGSLAGDFDIEKEIDREIGRSMKL
jgi:hypothetical protein